jgi:transposase InsO family protein
MPSRSGPATFSQATFLFFRSLFAFFTTLLHSRKVIHVGVTGSPIDAWTAQQRSFATVFGVGPKYLIRDNDSKFGVTFDRVAKSSGIKILKTPYRAPRANAICERFLGSVRRECLDHLLILHEKQHEPRSQCLCGLLQSGPTAGSALGNRYLNRADQRFPLTTQARR